MTAGELAAVPADEGLFSWPDEPRLIGGSCTACGTTTFPSQLSCPRCTGTDVRAVPLATTGRLWTWTVQAFEPKAPYRTPDAGFTPYGVGYVDLGDVIVESRLLGDPALFEIGMPMRLTLLSLWADQVTYAFEASDE